MEKQRYIDFVFTRTAYLPQVNVRLVLINYIQYRAVTVCVRYYDTYRRWNKWAWLK